MHNKLLRVSNLDEAKKKLFMEIVLAKCFLKDLKLILLTEDIGLESACTLSTYAS